MDVITIAIITGLASLSAGFGVSMVVTKTVEGIARQPELQGALTITMLIGAALVEAVPIISVIIAFMLLP